MLILSLDSAGHGCSAAVLHNDVCLAFKEERMERGQDQRLIPIVLEVMQKAGFEFKDLDSIAVTRGPGSFTGLRIGLAAARGLGLAAKKPVIGIDRFSIFYAQMSSRKKNLCVLIDAKRTELYCRFYPKSGAHEAPNMMTPDEISQFLEIHPDTVVTGDITPNIRCDFQPATEHEVLTAAKLVAHIDIHDTTYLPRPLYIRPPDVTIKKPKPHIRPLTLKDEALLSKMHIECFGASGWNTAQIRGSLDLPTTEGWILSQGPGDVGFILCQTAASQSEILTFCVKPSHRRKGIGSTLLGHVIQIAMNKGCENLYLEVAANNQAARQLYEKHGFLVTGKRPHYYNDGADNVDAILYTLPLTPPPKVV